MNNVIYLDKLFTQSYIDEYFDEKDIKNIHNKTRKNIRNLINKNLMNKNLVLNKENKKKKIIIGDFL